MSIFSINPDEVMASLFKINQASESALPEVGDVKPNGVHPNTDVGPATMFEFELANSATDIGMAIQAVQSLLAIEHENIKATMEKLVALDTSLADESSTFLGAIDEIPAPARASQSSASTANTAIG